MFGEIVRGYRRRLGLTQEDLAAATGLSVRSVGNLEAGRTAAPRPATVHLLADAFGLAGADRELFLRAAAGEGDRRPAGAAVPAQLPPLARGFAGRGEQLARLDGILDAAGSEPTAAVICAVSGTAGVGKTTFAVHWAHRVAHRFPDGQLYVNLRGFDHGGRVMAPAEAMRGFLDALGVPAGRIPPGQDAQVGLYRSLLAGRRMLVVLDNARDAEHLRPLLPGTPTAVTVVTSRNQLTPLVAADGAHPVNLDLLSPAEARELLARRLGSDRMLADPGAVEAVVSACARLPLALSIAAARAQQTGFPLAVLAAELGTAGRSLDALDAGDAASQVRAVFSWSYAALGAPAATVFRRLGLHPGPDISAATAASLVDRPVVEARRLLSELKRANLLTEHAPGRYGFHDLLRAYAAGLAAGDDRVQTRAARARLLDHYTHTAHAAARLLWPDRNPIRLPLRPPAPGTRPEYLTDRQQADAWLATEQTGVLAALRQATEAGYETQAWQLAWALDRFLFWRCRYHDVVAAWQTALRAAERLGHLSGQAYAHRRLAYACTQLGRYAATRAHLGQALELYTQTGDLSGRAQSQRHHGTVCAQEGRFDEALAHCQRARKLSQAAGNRHLEGIALNDISFAYVRLGEFSRALVPGEQAIALLQRHGQRDAEGHAWDTVGEAHHRLGHHIRAIDCYRRSLALFRAVGNQRNAALALTHLGEAHQATDDLTSAREAWQEALDVLTDLHHPDADVVRARLHDLGSPGPVR